MELKPQFLVHQQTYRCAPVQIGSTKEGLPGESRISQLRKSLILAGRSDKCAAFSELTVSRI